MNINWYPGHMKKTMDNIRLSITGFLLLIGILESIISPTISTNFNEKECKNRR